MNWKRLGKAAVIILLMYACWGRPGLRWDVLTLLAVVRLFVVNMVLALMLADVLYNPARPRREKEGE